MSSYTFTGWSPPVPAGRSFDLFSMLPQKNRSEDTSGDLARFISIFQEVVNLVLYDIDTFTQIIDPANAPEAFVDAMLVDLGNPFTEFVLDLTDKRRLLLLLVAMAQEKGTDDGMVNVARFFLGLTVTIVPIGFGTWILGSSTLGQDGGPPGTCGLGSSDSVTLNTFDVHVTVNITDTQAEQLIALCNYMRPAWTHLREIVQPSSPPVYDPVELGISRLGVDWILHEG